MFLALLSCCASWRNALRTQQADRRPNHTGVHDESTLRVIDVIDVT
jgi:hypothetical protein